MGTRQEEQQKKAFATQCVALRLTPRRREDPTKDVPRLRGGEAELLPHVAAAATTTTRHPLLREWGLSK